MSAKYKRIKVGKVILKVSLLLYIKRSSQKACYLHLIKVVKKCQVFVCSGYILFEGNHTKVGLIEKLFKPI